MSENPIKKYVSIKEAAVFLSVPVSWLYSRSRCNTIPMCRLGKYVRFDLSELEAWMKAGCPTGRN